MDLPGIVTRDSSNIKYDSIMIRKKDVKKFHKAFDSFAASIQFTTETEVTKENDATITNVKWTKEVKIDPTLRDRYNIYLEQANDGHGNDFTTGEPLLTFDEWLNN